MSFYINYVFSEIEYDDTMFKGAFKADDGEFCRFIYDRTTKETKIWDSSMPLSEIMPLPIHWLEYKLQQNGKLNKIEAKISY
jgi:hypothetical protein